MNTLARQFKTYIVEARFTSLFTTIIVLVMRLLLFLQKGLPQSEATDAGFVWPYVGHFFENPWISFLAATASVFVIAIFISQLNLRYGIIRMRTSLSYIFPLILFSVHPFFLPMSPAYLSTIFILWALFPLLDSYDYPSTPQKYAFQSSILLSIAAFFEIYSLLLIPFWWAAQHSVSSFRIKSFFASLWGIVLVFWIVFAFYVFGDNIAGFVAPFLHLTEIIDVTHIPTYTVPQWGFIATLLILVVVYISADSKHLRRDKVFSQKILSYIILLIAFCLIFQAIYLTRTLFWLYLIVALVSFIVSHYYTVVGRKWEIYSFFILLILLLLLYYVNYFTNSSPF